MERQEGYYWVKYFGDFVIARYDRMGYWDMFGDDSSYMDNRFEFINENRIKEPGELPE